MSCKNRVFILTVCLLALTAGWVLSARPTARAQTIPIHLRPCCLTSEQQDILSHMSVEWLDDGRGGQVKTIRFTGVNVQVVNGLGATNGYPLDPVTIDPNLTATDR